MKRRKKNRDCWRYERLLWRRANARNVSYGFFFSRCISSAWSTFSWPPRDSINWLFRTNYLLGSRKGHELSNNPKKMNQLGKIKHCRSQWDESEMKNEKKTTYISIIWVREQVFQNFERQQMKLYNAFSHAIVLLTIIPGFPTIGYPGAFMYDTARFLMQRISPLYRARFHEIWVARLWSFHPGSRCMVGRYTCSFYCNQTSVVTWSTGAAAAGSVAPAPPSSISSTKFAGNMPWWPLGAVPRHQPSSIISILVMTSPGSKVTSVWSTKQTNKQNNDVAATLRSICLTACVKCRQTVLVNLPFVDRANTCIEPYKPKKTMEV